MPDPILSTISIETNLNQKTGLPRISQKDRFERANGKTMEIAVEGAVASRLLLDEVRTVLTGAQPAKDLTNLAQRVSQETLTQFKKGNGYAAGNREYSKDEDADKFSNRVVHEVMERLKSLVLEAGNKPLDAKAVKELEANLQSHLISLRPRETPSTDGRKELSTSTPVSDSFSVSSVLKRTRSRGETAVQNELHAVGYKAGKEILEKYYDKQTNSYTVAGKTFGTEEEQKRLLFTVASKVTDHLQNQVSDQTKGSYPVGVDFKQIFDAIFQRKEPARLVDMANEETLTREMRETLRQNIVPQSRGIGTSLGLESANELLRIGYQGGRAVLDSLPAGYFKTPEQRTAFLQRLAHEADELLMQYSYDKPRTLPTGRIYTVGGDGAPLEASLYRAFSQNVEPRYEPGYLAKPHSKDLSKEFNEGVSDLTRRLRPMLSSGYGDAAKSYTDLMKVVCEDAQKFIAEHTVNGSIQLRGNSIPEPQRDRLLNSLAEKYANLVEDFKFSEYNPVRWSMPQDRIERQRMIYEVLKNGTPSLQWTGDVLDRDVRKALEKDAQQKFGY